MADYTDHAAYATSYAYNGNQLTRVTDFATGDYNPFGFNENGANNTIDYDYDANGNMKWDND